MKKTSKVKILFIKIADFTFKINFFPTFFPQTQLALIKNLEKYLNGHIIDADKNNAFIDYTIDIEERLDIPSLSSNISNIEKKYVKLYSKSRRKIKTYYYLSFIQLLLIFRDVLQILLTDNNGFQLHSSASIVKNQLILFVGKHTAGKSTATKLISKKFTTFADDNVAIRQINNRFYAYQTFEYEKNYVKPFMDGVEVKAVNFIYKSSETYAVNILDKTSINKLLLKECWSSSDKTLLTQMSTIQNFINSEIQFKKLYFSKQEDSLIKLITSVFDFNHYEELPDDT